MDDLDAVRETLNGNVDAFSFIVNKYTPLLYSLAFRMSDSSEDAADAVQEIFLRAYKSLNTYNLRYKFYTWLYTIALNYLRSAGKKQKLLKVLTFDFNYSGFHGNTKISEPVSKQLSPEENSIFKEGERLGKKALKSINRKEREVFILRELENFSVEETSVLLDIPGGTVKNRLHRAKKKIAAYMKKWQWDE